MEFTETVKWQGTTFEVELTGISGQQSFESKSMGNYDMFQAKCRIQGSPTWRARNQVVSRKVEKDEPPLNDSEIFYWVAQDFIQNAKAWESPEKEQGEGVEAFPVWGEDSVSRDAQMGNIPVDSDPAEEEEEPEGDVVFDRSKGGFVKAANE